MLQCRSRCTISTYSSMEIAQWIKGMVLWGMQIDIISRFIRLRKVGTRIDHFCIILKTFPAVSMPWLKWSSIVGCPGQVTKRGRPAQWFPWRRRLPLREVRSHHEGWCFSSTPRDSRPSLASFRSLHRGPCGGSVVYREKSAEESKYQRWMRWYFLLKNSSTPLTFVESLAERAWHRDSCPVGFHGRLPTTKSWPNVRSSLLRRSSHTLQNLGTTCAIKVKAGHYFCVNKPFIDVLIPDAWIYHIIQFHHVSMC